MRTSGLLLGSLVLTAALACSAPDRPFAEPETTTASSGSGSGGGGGSGGGASTSCGGAACSPAGAGEASCCFKNHDGSERCGSVVSDWGPACAPIGLPAGADATCPSKDLAGRTLAGCCLEAGLCGVSDPEHPEIGCVPGATVGLADRPCGGSTCAPLCILAAASTCSAAKATPFGVYSCTATCADGGCADEVTALASCAAAPGDGCQADGMPLYSACMREHVALAACRKNDDCGLYCGGLAALCPPGDQFVDTPECLAFCEQMKSSPPSADNTVACRMKQLSVVPDTAKCSAAGPSGAGTLANPQSPVCGNVCPAYCWLMQHVCAPEFASSYGGMAQCESHCNTLPSSPPYGATTPKANTVQCRLAAAVRAAAASDKSAACAAADKTSTECVAGGGGSGGGN